MSQQCQHIQKGSEGLLWFCVPSVSPVGPFGLCSAHSALHQTTVILNPSAMRGRRMYMGCASWDNEEV